MVFVVFDNQFELVLDQKSLIFKPNKKICYILPFLLNEFDKYTKKEV